MSKQKTFWDTCNVTSSLGSADGQEPLSLLDGQSIEKSGPVPCPALWLGQLC